MFLTFLLLVPYYNDTVQPCSPSPCGPNSICHEKNNVGSCVCIEGYFGDPYLGCRPECVINSDCPFNKACFDNKCKDPCLGNCGINAQCTVVNHIPNCVCFESYTGNPIEVCYETPLVDESKKSIFLIVVVLY